MTYNIDVHLLNAQMGSIEEAGDAFANAIARDSDGHLADAIAGAAAVAGLKILRRSGADIATLPVGTIILSDIHAAEANVFAFLNFTAEHLEIKSGPFWKRRVPDEYLPRLTAGTLAGTMEPLFDEVLRGYQIWHGFHPFAAVYAAMRMVASAHESRQLHCAAGRALVERYLVEGARTVPSVERLLAHATFTWQSRLFALGVTDRAVYIPVAIPWSLAQPWALRRIPVEHVKRVTVKRPSLSRVVLVGALITHDRRSRDIPHDVAILGWAQRQIVISADHRHDRWRHLAIQDAPPPHSDGGV